MGAEIANGEATTPVPYKPKEHIEAPLPPLVLGLQASALVDHVASVDGSLLDHIPGERGGSLQVAIKELEHILHEVRSCTLPSQDDFCTVRTIAGGSVANTIRGLAAGFGVTCGLIGACGDDEQGRLFVDNMVANGVNLSRVRMKKGPTAQAEELPGDNFKGSKWMILRFGTYHLELTRAAIRIAKREGLRVSLDLASFEMVRKNKGVLVELLQSGDIDLCFANEDEALELIRDKQLTDPEAALGYLGMHCEWAVVTLGSSGCIARHGTEIVKVPAIGDAKPTDATGAGDLFASGFIYGLITGLSLEDCCWFGACSGGAVIRSLGGDVTAENRRWMYKQLQIKGLPVPELSENKLVQKVDVM